MDRPTIEELVTFSILMEQNEGILGKSPRYIREKWQMMSVRKGILDCAGKSKYNEYMSKWDIRENNGK